VAGVARRSSVRLLIECTRQRQRLKFVTVCHIAVVRRGHTNKLVLCGTSLAQQCTSAPKLVAVAYIRNKLLLVHVHSVVALWLQESVRDPG
jgi:hypothetical protein